LSPVPEVSDKEETAGYLQFALLVFNFFAVIHKFAIDCDMSLNHSF
jgi:hypothetical protein